MRGAPRVESDSKMNTEPKITINGMDLTEGEAMTMRVAITFFLDDISSRNALGSDDVGKGIASGYAACSSSILRKMLNNERGR